MSLRRNLLLFLLFFMKYCLCDNQTIFTLNGKKSLHVVSDTFLSVSVDPAVLLSGLNISGTSLFLTKNLSPSYIRIAGPSTKLLQFTEGEEGTTYQIIDETLSLTVTPSQWDSLNEWFIKTNLVPILAINDRDGPHGKFDPKTIFSLLGLSDKINVSCLWQLGYDSSKKQVTQYIEEIKSMRNVLNAFPNEAKTWKIVGSDVNALQYTSSENLSQTLQALEGVAHSVMWESKQDEDSFPQTDAMTDLLSAPTKPKLSVWTAAPKNKHAVSFASGLLWAKQIGEAATKGFGVVFRQPRVYEFFTDTPVYWISVLHKKLMGLNVLDVKANDNRKTGINVYAHCSKRQNNFSRRGAATILMVNTESIEHTVALRILGFTLLKTIEVQSYTLTSDDPDSADIYLNGQKLTRALLQDNHVEFTPKIRRAKINKYLTFDVPPKSVNFLVLPDTRIQACINSEEETNLLIEEIHADQKINFSSDLPTKISSRFREEEEEKDDTPVTLTRLYNEMQKELEVDEKYYSGVSKPVQKEYYWNPRKLNETTPVDDAHENNKSTKESAEVFESNVRRDLIRNKFAEKRSAFLRKLTENSKLIANKLDKAPNIPLRQSYDKKMNNPKENSNLASDELDEIILTATKIIKGENSGAPKYKRDCKGGGRGGHGRGRGSGSRSKQTLTIAKPTPKPKSKPKRAINMDLLREKSDEAYMTGKFGTNPNKQVEKIKSRETDFASEMKRQHDKIKADLEKLLHPKETKVQQRVRTHSLNSVEKTNNDKPDFAAEAKKQYDKMKLDLEKMLHPKATKNEQRLQTRVFNSEEDYFDQSNNFDSFGDDDDDDVNGYEKIDEEFKLGSPKKDLWEERLYWKAGRNRSPSSFLGKEFVVDSKDPRVVEKTIKNLEDYFNRPQNRRYEFDDDGDDISVEYDYDDMDDFNYQKPPTRFKRDDKHYTEADIRYYRQLMNHNIKHMRESIRKQQRESLKLKPFQKVKPKYIMAPKPSLQPNLSNSLKGRTNVEHLKSPRMNDLSYSNNTANLENKKIENGVKYLKNRLAHHKRIEDVQQGGMRLRSAGPEANDETQRLLNLIKSELRKRRSRSASCEPKVDSSKLLSENPDCKIEEEKVPNKEDIMKSRKIRPFETTQVIPVVNGSLKKVRVKRFIDMDSSYKVNDFFNKDRNVEKIWVRKVTTGKYDEVEEAPFCDLNNATVNVNASIDFRDSIESKSEGKSKEANINFADDLFNFFSKLLYKVFTNV